MPSKNYLPEFLILYLFISYNIPDNHQIVSAQNTIDIDFSGVAPINSGVNATGGGKYIFTKNIDLTIRILTSNIILDGKGFNATAGIQIHFVNNVTIQNIQFSGIETHALIRNSDDIRILDNIFFETNIQLYESSNIVISRNSISAFDYGIHSIETSYVEITSNNISSSKDGLFMNFCDFTTVRENNILQPSSPTVRGYVGFNFQHCDHNIVSENIIIGYQYGAWLAYSNNNTIYENTFTDLSEGIVWLEGENRENKWDYNNRGNYYFDYADKYPNAGKNGEVMDTPYIHNDYNVDNYPLFYEAPIVPIAEETGKIRTTIIVESPSGDRIYLDDDPIILRGNIEPRISYATLRVEFVEGDGPEREISETSCNEEGDFSKAIDTSGLSPGTYSVTVVFEETPTHLGSEVLVGFSVEEEDTVLSGCFIATATYGSEISPEVDFLRGFRDNTVYSTYAGSKFMTIFNEWYYSFSPAIAQVIANNEILRSVMKLILYPLIGILHLSYYMFTFLRFFPELAIVTAGFVASSLIGLIYFTPGAFLLSYNMHICPSDKIIRLMSYMLVGCIIVMFVAGITRYSFLMMYSTASFIILTIGFNSLYTIRKYYDIYE